MDKKKYSKQFKQNLNLIIRGIPRLPNRNALDTVMIKSHKIRSNAIDQKHESAASLSKIIELISFKVKNKELKMNQEIKDNFSKIVELLEKSAELYENKEELEISKYKKDKLNAFSKKYLKEKIY